MSHYTTHADLGGLPGFGVVKPEAESDLFHADWERKTLALTLAVGATGSWNIDQSRASRETLPDYLKLSYYQIWLAALEKLLRERGLVTADEIQSGILEQPPLTVARVLQAQGVPAALLKGSPVLREPTQPARFQVGQRVRTRSKVVGHHTRLPGYTRGKQGLIERVHGVHVFADSHAKGMGEDPQWLYGVVFDEAELWPERTRPSSAQGLKVSIDAWEPYLEAV
ncbi:MAG: nitrile hydratase subunit beta [Hydrogenophaga sp.]|uniref:nitrile hydratase subunit beta n=1 Tax=Hydrogenophaga sp. TaxID=1904254 RepID=UPI002AB8A04F|nr:nitrile hydratase subunit beta [Hydrogenophaga sp.]MDZ4101828.1 nitrile hydratase subunit beta [Hydrogenophaga sp.]